MYSIFWEGLKSCIKLILSHLNALADGCLWSNNFLRMYTRSIKFSREISSEIILLFILRQMNYIIIIKK